MHEHALITDTLAELQIAAPAGYAIGLHVLYTTPTYMFQAYPRDWLDHYAQKGFLPADPTVHWGLQNTGHIRWSDLADQDPRGVYSAAQQFGLRYGASIAIGDDTSRSIAGFARADREFTEAEMRTFVVQMTHMHCLTADARALDAKTKAVLRKLSIN